MNNLCKCCHPFEEHKAYYSMSTACWHKRRDTYGGVPICECLVFRKMSNLEYLEYKYEASTK